MISSVRSQSQHQTTEGSLLLEPADSPEIELVSDEYAVSDRLLTICMTIFIFRGDPDFYYKRHALLYFSSPDDPSMHETVHTQRQDEGAPWNVYHLHGKTDWSEPPNYQDHVNAGAVMVRRDDRMTPVNLVAATVVEGRHLDAGWNCQNFVLEGLQALVRRGLQSQEWYDAVEGELLDKLIEGAVG